MPKRTDRLEALFSSFGSISTLQSETNHFQKHNGLLASADQFQFNIFLFRRVIALLREIWFDKVTSVYRVSRKSRRMTECSERPPSLLSRSGTCIFRDREGS